MSETTYTCCRHCVVEPGEAAHATHSAACEFDCNKPPRLFTADEVIEIANETSDSLGNLYRLDFIDRIQHESAISNAPAEDTDRTTDRREVAAEEQEKGTEA